MNKTKSNGSIHWSANGFKRANGLQLTAIYTLGKNMLIGITMMVMHLPWICFDVIHLWREMEKTTLRNNIIIKKQEHDSLTMKLKNNVNNCKERGK